MEDVEWKGRVLKTDTLQDYGRRIRRTLTEQGFGQYWKYSSDEVAWMPANVDLDS